MQLIAKPFLLRLSSGSRSTEGGDHVALMYHDKKAGEKSHREMRRQNSICAVPTLTDSADAGMGGGERGRGGK